MSRRTTIRVDEATPCFLPENRDIFDMVIDVTHPAMHVSGDSKRARAAISAARRICFACPEREQCFAVHGDDLTLGVVAGKSNAQRAQLFGRQESS